MSVLRAAALAAAAVLAAAGCTSDEDCNLNGACKADGTCSCVAPWTGADCGLLDFLPAAAPDGALYRRANTSSWCAGVVRDDENVWHAYVAVMKGNCGLNSWESNSEIVHAVSTTGPTGPFFNDSVIRVPFSHNPKPIRAPDGTYLIFHIGCGDGGSNALTNCVGGVTPINETDGTIGTGGSSSGCGIQYSMLLSSPSPYGPWANSTAFGPSAGPGVPFPISVDNPAPFFYPNGSIGVMFRSYTRQYPTYHSVIGIARAPSWKGPYTLPTQPIFMPFEEDPFWWYQPATASYHALYHDMGGCSNVGCHAWSRDSINWTLSKTPAYNYSVSFTDGSTTVFRRRERPQLVFDPVTGVPTHLINGVQLPRNKQPAIPNSQGDYTYSIVVPLRTP